MKTTSLIPALLFLGISCAGFGQNEESLTITTFFPAPYGAYRTVRLWPDDSVSSGTACVDEGELIYSQSGHALMVCKGNPPLVPLTWMAIGSSLSGTGLKSYSGTISPSQCSNPTGPDHPTIPGMKQTCHGWWYDQVTFPSAFKSTPHLLVMPLIAPDPVNSPCARHNDEIFAKAESVTKNGFEIHGGGSSTHADDASCGNVEADFTRAVVYWVAVGD